MEAEVLRNNPKMDEEEMLKLRRKISKIDDPEFNRIKKDNDFYSASLVRDLLFHVQKHRFTIPQIRDALEELGLTFMGFEFLDKKAKEPFKVTYPEEGSIHDLDKWHEYEISNPDQLAGYSFWLQRV